MAAHWSNRFPKLAPRWRVERLLEAAVDQRLQRESKNHDVLRETKASRAWRLMSERRSSSLFCHDLLRDTTRFTLRRSCGFSKVRDRRILRGFAGGIRAYEMAVNSARIRRDLANIAPRSVGRGGSVRPRCSRADCAVSEPSSAASFHGALQRLGCGEGFSQPDVS